MLESVKDLYRLIPNEESESPKPPKIMLLFGAGASRPAGIPVIGEMTRKFLENPVDEIRDTGIGISRSYKITRISDVKNYLSIIADLTDKYFQGKMDIELMMSLMLELEDPKFRTLFEKTYPDIKSMSLEALQLIKSLTEEHIRKSCENFSKIDYLWPLTGISSVKPLNLFTLNYDATVEIFCEKNGVKYTDGFDPYWNTSTFEKDSEVNIYKLHGSLYWFRSKSGKTIRVPIKGLQVSQVKYLTDESISEMMIYPALQKDKESMVYSWLSQKFKESLNDCQICVVIGYSFRDEGIKNSIVESLSGNRKLWLVIVDPHASQYKTELFSYDYDIASKVVTMDMGIEEALRERNLHSYLSTLDNARKTEEDTLLGQQSSQYRLDREWRHALTNYQSIKHHDRIRWIVEKLSGEKFTDSNNGFPETIEGIVCENALSYALEYSVKGDKERMDIWKKIFLEICIAIEYKLFEMHLIYIKEHNPVKKEELPFWCKTSGAGYVITYYIEKMEAELSNLVSSTTSDPIKKPLEKLVETLKLVTNKGPIKGSGGSVALEHEQIWERYQTNDLGIKKWATEIVNSLN